MSENEHEKLLMAYLDGQMSATEAAAFDESLTERERECIAAELRLETGIAERLRGGAACPEATWKRTQLLLRNQSTGRSRRWNVLRRGMAAAAVLAVAAAGYVTLRPGAEGVLALPEAKVAIFAATSEVVVEAAAVRTYLKSHGLDGALAPLEAVHPESQHKAKLLGARTREYQNESVVELLYDCCGQSVKVVLAPPDSSVAEALLNGAVNGRTVWAARRMPQYVAGVISKHDASDLIDLLQPAAG